MSGWLMDDSVYLMQLIMQHSMYYYFCYFIAIWMTLLGKKIQTNSDSAVFLHILHIITWKIYIFKQVKCYISHLHLLDIFIINTESPVSSVFTGKKNITACVGF